MSAQFKMQCPECGTRLRVPEHLANKATICPGCQKPIIAKLKFFYGVNLWPGRRLVFAVLAIALPILLLIFLARRTTDPLGNFGLGLVVPCFLFLGLFIYFIPAYIARRRHHRNTAGIFVLNLFFGWSVLGWIGALLWAIYQEKA